MLKPALLIIAISVVGCESLPPTPEVVQYGIYADVEPPGFYGVNNKTKERTYRRFIDPKMKAGQCLDAKDYKEMQDWVKKVKQISEERCK
jgi:hypothetical protein